VKKIDPYLLLISSFLLRVYYLALIYFTHIAASGTLTPGFQRYVSVHPYPFP